MLPAIRTGRRRRTRTAACCALLALTHAAGCSAKPRAHDPADAAYALDVMPAAWCYEDQPLNVRADFDCWSRRHKDRMRFLPGTYVYEYTIKAREARPVVLRQPWKSPVQWSGDLKSLPGAPKCLAAGRHTLTIRAVLPSGKAVKGSFVRRFDVRKRELRLSLTCDKPTYKVGEPIILTGSVENILGGDLDLTGLRMLKVVLQAGGDRLPVKGIRLPKTLRPGKPHRLFQLRFTAGVSDRRFLMGPRAELTPLPFAMKGKYRMELTMRLALAARTPSTAPGAGKATAPAAMPAERYMEALPAKATFQIVP